MSQPVSCADDRAPRDFRVPFTDRARDVGGRLADEFQIAQRGIVGKPIGDERGLIHPVGMLRQSFAARERAAIDKRDRNIINAHADELNEEAVDVLGYQVET